jgi:hypothetical protein
MNQLSKDCNVVIDELNRIKSVPLADEVSKEHGWTFSNDFIEQVKKGVLHMDIGSVPSSEEVDDILIFLRDNNYIKTE